VRRLEAGGRISAAAGVPLIAVRTNVLELSGTTAGQLARNPLRKNESMFYTASPAPQGFQPSAPDGLDHRSTVGPVGAIFLLASRPTTMASSSRSQNLPRLRTRQLRHLPVPFGTRPRISEVRRHETC
jgi:hypothetical protein